MAGDYCRSYNVPIAIIFYHRADKVKRLVAEIAKIRPSRLYLLADGPKDDQDKALCEDSRQVIDSINWDCDLITDFSPKNLGSKRRIVSGLDLVFSQVDQAIIIEDDCIPHPSFFTFCQELLSRYADDERIMSIAGDGFQMGNNPTDNDYYFSIYQHTIGWATWKRAWQKNDITMALWPELRETHFLEDLFRGNPSIAKATTANFDLAYKNLVDAWDYQWNFSCWTQNALSILPYVTLVSHEGYGDLATHCKEKDIFCNNLPLIGLQQPIRHPAAVMRNYDADLNYSLNYVVPHSKNIYQHIRRYVKKIYHTFHPIKTQPVYYP